MGDLSKNFSRYEFACECGCGFDTVDVKLIEVLQDCCDHFGARGFINSGCRCEAHNATIPGAAPTSQHVYGRAADFRIEGFHENAVADYLESRWPECSIGRYTGRTHVDTRTNGPARWDYRGK